VDAKRAWALGKVEELCWKNCAGEWQVKLNVMWGRKIKRLGATRWERERERERERLHSSILYFFYFLCCLFYFGTEETAERRKWKVSCVIVALALSQYHQIEPFYFPLLVVWVAWGLLCFSSLPPAVPPLLVIPFYLFFFFCSFLPW